MNCKKAEEFWKKLRGSDKNLYEIKNRLEFFNATKIQFLEEKI